MNDEQQVTKPRQSIKIMKLVNQSAELVEQEPGFEGMLRHIERCGRVCYKSEDKITDGSARKFVEMLIKNGHTSVLEHGECITGDNRSTAGCKYVRHIKPYNIVTNFRYIIEEVCDYDTAEENIQFDTPPIGLQRRVTFHIITSRAILDELLRHRTLSASVESTRFCNYAKRKFNGELTFVKPSDWKDLSSSKKSGFQRVFRDIETAYSEAIGAGLKPQQARAVLPLSIKSEAYLTAFVDDWAEILRKRITPAAHPDAVALCTMIREQLIKAGYLNDQQLPMCV